MTDDTGKGLESSYLSTRFSNAVAAAINKAISDGDRCGADCGSSTIYPAVVFFPPGTYLVSSPIIQYYNTQFLGDVCLQLPYSMLVPRLILIARGLSHTSSCLLLCRARSNNV